MDAEKKKLEKQLRKLKKENKDLHAKLKKAPAPDDDEEGGESYGDKGKGSGFEGKLAS